MTSIILAQHRQPRGPRNNLHRAAYCGSTQLTIALLSKGSINIDQGDPDGMTPLMFAAQEGHSRVIRTLLNSRADVSIVMGGGFTALHFSSQNGHLAATIDLATAGADPNAPAHEGATPLHLAVQEGHPEVAVALIEAGANVDSRAKSGATSLFLAAGQGYVDIARALLRAKANPLLSTNASPNSGPLKFSPLDVAAQNGHSRVVRELIKQRGIEGWGGPSGGVDALAAAAKNNHVEVMALLMGAGVVDSGEALVFAARGGGEAAVKFLLQQRQLTGSRTGLVGYANSCDSGGCTAFFNSVASCADARGEPRLLSPRMVRWLIDAGADTTSAVEVANKAGVAQLNVTPLAYTNQRLREKKVEGKDATEEQLHRLEAVRRLLLRVEAVHAVAWQWHSHVPSVTQGAGDTSRATRATTAGSTQLLLMLPILRRRRRGVLLARLPRYSSYP